MAGHVKKRATLPVAERDFQLAVVGLARLRGWEVFHVWRSDHSPAGYPDLTMARYLPPGPGRFLLVELKTVRGKLTPEQYQWLWLGAHCGIETYCWNPDDWPDIQRVLE